MQHKVKQCHSYDYLTQYSSMTCAMPTQCHLYSRIIHYRKTCRVSISVIVPTSEQYHTSEDKICWISSYNTKFEDYKNLEIRNVYDCLWYISLAKAMHGVLYLPLQKFNHQVKIVNTNAECVIFVLTYTIVTIVYRKVPTREKNHLVQ